MSCFDRSTRDRPGLADVGGDESINAINPGAGISYADCLAERAKRNLLGAIEDDDGFATTLSTGTEVIVNFNKLKFFSLADYERRFVMALLAAVADYDSLGGTK